jgi:hypothetical protein
VWDKQHGVDVERRRLLERTRELVARGLGAGNLWHSASHAEHARPMLQVWESFAVHPLPGQGRVSSSLLQQMSSWS